LSKDSQAQVKTIRLSLEVQSSFQLEIFEFFPFFFLDAILTVLDPDPHSQYGSGSRGAISIRISIQGSHFKPDPHGSRSGSEILELALSCKLFSALHKVFLLRVANFFLAEGFVKGDSVAVFMANRPEFVCVWLGLAKIGTLIDLKSSGNHNLLLGTAPSRTS